MTLCGGFMHVLIFPSWYPKDNSQSGIFFREQAEDLVQEGIHVTICSIDLNLRGPFRTKTEYAEENGVHVYRIYGRHFTPFWEAGIQRQKKRFMEKIWNRILSEQGRPDIVHMESSRLTEPVRDFCKKHDLPWTFTEHFSQILVSEPRSHFDRVFRTATQESSHAFYISSPVRDRMLQYGISETHCSYVPNSVRFSFFPEVRQNQKNPFVFKALGNLIPIKGYDLLLKAMAKVVRQEADVQLVIGGKGAEQESLRQLAQKLEITEHVTFSGQIPRKDTPEFMRTASTFICSSRLETFSVVIIEALASGVPVIATDCGGPRDLVTRQNGLLVPTENPDALAQAMLYMKEHASEYSPTEIREDARNRFDSKKIAQRKIAIWQSLIK